MRIRNIALAARPLSVALCLALFATSPQGLAADWDLQTAIEASINYSDNINLANDGAELSDTVYALSPRFTLARKTQRIQADIRYSPQALFYSRFDSADQVFHTFDGTLATELVPDRLYVDFSASKFQSIIDPDGRFPTDNLAISNNRADSTIISINPYFKQRVGTADMRIDLSHTQASYDDESVVALQSFQSNTQNGARFNLSNLARETRFTWALDYNYQRVSYDEAIPYEYQRAGAEVGVWVQDAVRVFVSGGLETAFDDYFSGDLEDDFWEAGVQLRPSKRIDATFAFGDRSFGSSMRADIKYTLQRGTTSFIYTEQPQTRGQLGNNRRPIRAIDDLDNLLDRAGASDRMVRKRGEWTTTLTLPKSKINWRVFTERRTQRTGADGVPLNDDEAVGAAIRFDWDLGRRTALNIGADIAQRDTQNGEEDFSGLTFGVAYTLTKKINLRFEATRSKQESEFSTGQFYTANRYMLAVTATL